MQIGALQLYDVPDVEREAFLGCVREQFRGRLPHTPLLCVRREAPLGVTSDVWLDIAGCDLEHHIRPVPTRQMTPAQVNAYVADKAREPLDLRLPPFEVHVMDSLAEGGCALFIKIHHAVADGVGLQAILRRLADPTPQAPMRRGERPPMAPLWLLSAAWKFWREAPARKAHAAAVDEAREAITPYRNDPALKRARTPTLKLSGPTSDARAYDTISLPLERFRAIGKQLGGTVNDVFLAVCAGAIRRSLIAIDDLPAEPLVASAARSYRRPEHGEFGNRIVALHPQLATHLADPMERFSAIRQSMAIELSRSRHEERMLGAPEAPFGPRKRRKAMAAHLASGRVLPGNVTLSNVPGPAEQPSLAGYRQLTNYPTPILNPGMFLNITMRRHGDMLDFGIMTDPEKLADLERLKADLGMSLEELEGLAP